MNFAPCESEWHAWSLNDQKICRWHIFRSKSLPQK
jgi:hypothetical protein